MFHGAWLRRRLRKSVAVPLEQLGAAMRQVDVKSLSVQASMPQSDLEIAGPAKASNSIVCSMSGQILELDGRMSVESEPGRGARFIVELSVESVS
jgi:glycine betaine/choline ABC-type transport system substrate-binding protein